MNYLQKNLRPGETIVAQAKISLIPLIPVAIWAVIILIIGIVIGSTAVLWAVLFDIVYVVLSVLRIKSVELGITNKKVIGKTGVIMANSLDTYLEKVDNISVSETLGGKIFGYATVQICTTSAKLRFPYVVAAFDFKNVAMDQIERREHDKMAMQAQIMSNPQAVTAGAAQSSGAGYSNGKCPVCGYVNNPASKFCEGCGKQL